MLHNVVFLFIVEIFRVWDAHLFELTAHQRFSTRRRRPAGIAATSEISATLTWQHTSYCYYWQTDNVSSNRPCVFCAFSRACLVGKHVNLEHRARREVAVSPSGFIQQRRDFRRRTRRHEDAGYVSSRGERMEWARPLPCCELSLVEASVKIRAMGQGTETCADRPTEVSVIRFVSRNRTIEEIAPKKVMLP